MELPCYVHDRQRDTALQCLVSDEAKPNCNAKHPATSRLCVCVGSSKKNKAISKQGAKLWKFWTLWTLEFQIGRFVSRFLFKLDAAIGSESIHKEWTLWKSHPESRLDVASTNCIDLLLILYISFWCKYELSTCCVVLLGLKNLYNSIQTLCQNLMKPILEARRNSVT